MGDPNIMYQAQLRHKKTKLATAIAALTLSGIAHANVLEEVTVTAQKREQSVQDVGIAVSAMTGDQMEALGYDSAQHVTAMAPGVSTIQPNGEANYAIGIRGVANSDFTTNVESPVAIYLDEVYISQMSGAGFSLFDMERVEILRGPQGTLFGRNATGGLAHFISRKPGEELNGYAKVTVGDYGQFKFEGAVGGPITETLSGRLSVSTHDNDGYITNRLGEDLNNAEDRSLRAQLLWQPSDELEVLLSLRGAEQDIRTGFFENVSSQLPGQLTPDQPNPVLGYIDNDGDVYAGDYDDPGFNDLETRGYTVTAKWDNDNFTLTSITDFSTVERRYIEDSDASPVSLFNFFLTTDAEQFSQEIRIDGETDTMKWVGGVYYLDLDIQDSNGAITAPFIGAVPTPGAEGGFQNPYSTQLQSISAFGQIEMPISDTVTFIAGARVINDDKDFEYSINVVEFLQPDIRGVDAPSNVIQLDQLASYSASRSDTEFSGRLALDWTPNDDTLIYVSWNRGVKGSGFNAPIFPVNPPGGYNDETLSYGPEQLDAFEVGAKLDFADGLARLNIAVYYYDYADYQAFNIIGLDTLTTNAEAESTGFEIELQASPTEGLDMLFGIAYNNIDVTLPDGSRTESVQSPEVMANAMIRYGMEIGGGELAFQTDWNYRGEHYFALTQLPNVTEDGYFVGNVSVSYTSPDDTWVASAFIENVTDEEYLVQTFDLSTDAVFGITEQYYGRPQWWGVSLKYNF
jgi:iron complex outermembrane receptor protein